jgi:hypothetical protein
MKDDERDTEDNSPHAYLQELEGVGDNGWESRSGSVAWILRSLENAG